MMLFTIEEIQKFCKADYDVSFPIMDKIHVKGEEQHKLYETLTGEKGAFPGDVRWNFGKFLIGKDGKAIARFEPTTKPDSAVCVQGTLPCSRWERTSVENSQVRMMS